MQALKRLVTILDLVAWRGQPAGAAEVAQSMGLPLSTAARLMRQLADEDLLSRSSVDGRYSLGPRIFALAGAGVTSMDVAEVARPVLEQLRDATGETLSLHVLRGTQRVCVAEVQSRHKVRRVVPPGITQDLLGTATGEVLLADAPPAELEATIVRAGLGRAARGRLEQRLALIRTRGYAYADDAVEGLTGISAPVRAGGRTVAAMSVSGPSARFTAEVAERHAAALVAAVAALSASL